MLRGSTISKLVTGCGLAGALAACSGSQSALDPAGRGAVSIYNLSLWLFFGGIVVWLLVIGLAVWVIYYKRERIPANRAALFIIGGGAVVPSIVLGVMLGFGLSIMPDLLEPAPPGSQRIAVRGEQWWWRVSYLGENDSTLELANEIRLPVGEPVEFLLTSSDVIHSFWVPALGPKMDMIPGRETRLTLHPTRVGRFRGVCAEFCGTSHALMALDVVVMEKGEFERWLEAQNQSQPVGSELFLSTGCGACHTVRGTAAKGALGPDLTHVGSRLTIGAGLLENDEEGFYRWLNRTESLKPEVHMPHFGMLPEAEQKALADYLESLQ